MEKYSKIKLINMIIIILILISITPSSQSLDNYIEKNPQKENIIFYNNSVWIVDQNGNGDFTSISDALSNVSVVSGDKIIVEEGFYDDNPLNIKNEKNNLLIIGNGSAKNIIIDSKNDGNVISIQPGGEGTVIQNFTITNTINISSYHGIEIKANNCVIKNCIINNNINGIYINGFVKHTLLENNTIYNNADRGIEISNYCFNSTISHCMISRNNNGGIYDFGINTSINNHSKIFNHKTSGITTGCLNSSINNCIIENNLKGVSLIFSTYVDMGITYKANISKCNLSNNNLSGFEIIAQQVLDVDWDNRYITIFNCNITDSEITGIRFDSLARNVDIIDCNINKTNNGDGISLVNNLNIKIRKCNISDNTGNGIAINKNLDYNTLKESKIILVENSIITNNDENGILILQGSIYNIITKCFLKGNGFYSIKIGEKYNFLDRLYGYIIRVGSSFFQNNLLDFLYNYREQHFDNFFKPETPSNNRFYLNSIYKGINTNQSAEDMGLNNDWYDDDNKIGNFWEGHYGPDINDDGIIEKPMITNEEDKMPGIDLYPLKYCIKNGSDCRKPIITLFFPNGNEHLRDIVNITWNASDLKNYRYMPNYTEELNYNNISVDILLSKDGGKKWDDEDPIVCNFPANSTFYLWDTSDIEDGIYYKIKINVTDENDNCRNDISSNNFSICNDGAYISKVTITDIIINSTEYFKDGDDLEISANIISEGLTKSSIWADLSCFEKHGENDHPESYNGITAIWILKNVECNLNDKITINIYAEDKKGIIATNIGTIICDNKPPTINITKPKNGVVYLLNMEIPFIKTILNNTVIFGRITFIVSPYDNNKVKKVKWYLDENLTYESHDGENHYWSWNIPNRHPLLLQTFYVEVYDYAENFYQSKNVTFRKLI